MNNIKKKLSIVTVCYNSESTISKTIESVISQSFTDYEYIIVDGESSDKTNCIIEKYKPYFFNKGINLIHISERDDGIYDAMNKGIDLSSGTWINFMNSDDTFYDKDVLKNIFLKDNNDADVIYGNENRIIGNNSRLNKADKNIDVIKKVKFFCHQSTFVRTKLMKKNKFCLDYKICSDYDNLLGLYLKGMKFKYIDSIVCNYSVEGTSNKNYCNTIREAYDIKKKYGLIDFSNIELYARIKFFYLKYLIDRIIMKKYVK